ncbi:DNA-directed RNA polymerase, putative isoform 1 [Hibiscus syriacus]|uniref:DNA-directed RNA polymerase, putative isoform 1 n=1 Tax=Hibiscus syriacus TaxID=106335 RepID=A0A6A3C8X8_HIBSY|nr:DNA-directed RNA polymerase, putative isoform 1 [Hibiscus syriacus]
MGTVVGISDLDPLRWPGSKWRNLQFHNLNLYPIFKRVEWDEPGCLKRPLHPGISGKLMFVMQSSVGTFLDTYVAFIRSECGNLIKRHFLQFSKNGHGNLPHLLSNSCSELLMEIMLNPQLVYHPGTFASTSQQISAAKVFPLDEVKNEQSTGNQKPQLTQSENMLIENPNPSQLALDQPDPTNLPKNNANGNPHPVNKFEGQTQARRNNQKVKLEPEHSTDQVSRLTATSECNEEKLSFRNQNQAPSQLQYNLCTIQSRLDSPVLQAYHMQVAQHDISSLSCFLPFLDTDEWVTSSAFSDSTNPSLTTGSRDALDYQLYDCRLSSQADQLCSFTQQDPRTSETRNLSDDSNNRSGIYSCLNIDVSNGGSTVIDLSISNIVDELCLLKDAEFQNPSDSLVGNFICNQDVQSQISSTCLAAWVFNQQDLTDNSVVTSSSNADFDENGLLQNISWQQITPRLRTYTKVQKAGSIDVTSFKNYDELISSIECMFGLKGLPGDPKGSGWKLVYVGSVDGHLLRLVYKLC